jgi:hypothetical protein
MDQPVTATWKGCIIGGIVWVFFLLPFSVFMFDAPGSEESMLTYFLAASLWTYPLFHLAAVLGSKIAFAQGAPKLIVILLAKLPLLNVIWFLAGIVFIEIFRQ